MKHIDTNTDRLIKHSCTNTYTLMKHADTNTDARIKYTATNSDTLIKHSDTQIHESYMLIQIQIHQCLCSIAKIDEKAYRLRKKSYPYSADSALVLSLHVSVLKLARFY